MAIPFASVPLAAFNGELDTDVAQWVWTLHTSTFAPNKLTQSTVSQLTNELAAGNGYTVGGVAAAATRTKTDANSWGTSRAASTAYTVGTVVRPATGNGLLYRATTAGTTGSTLPTYPTVVGQTVTDGGVVWQCVGSSITVITTANPVWAAASFSGVRYAVLSYRNAGTAATQPLIAFIDYVTDKAGQGGAFTVTLPTQGVLHLFTP